MLHFIIP